MSLADKLLEVANNLPRVFEAGEQKHKMRYQSVLIRGNGTGALQFDCPFKPDYILVAAHDADAHSAVNSVILAAFDFRTFAMVGGFLRTRQSGSYKNNAVTATTGVNYFLWADGLCTVAPPSSYNVVYPTDVRYICTAVRYTDKSDKELLEEEIALLADTGGTIQYSESRINETVTDAEWQALIAQKSGRTFALS